MQRPDCLPFRRTQRVRREPRGYVNDHGPLTDQYRDELVEITGSGNQEYPESDAVNEMVMVVNGFDVDSDDDDEVYAVNTRAFAYGVGATDGDGRREEAT